MAALIPLLLVLALPATVLGIAYVLRRKSSGLSGVELVNAGMCMARQNERLRAETEGLI